MRFIIKILHRLVGTSLERGHPTAVRVGGFVGALLGLTISLLLSPPFFVFGVLAGALLGIVIAARLRPKPQTLATTTAEPFGQVLKVWTFNRPEFFRLAVLLERGFYLASADPRRDAPWPAALQALKDGMDPDLKCGCLVRVADLEDIERRRADSRELEVRFRRDSKIHSAMAEFASIEERDQFIHGLEHTRGREFRHERRALDVGRAIFAPSLLIAILAAPMIGLAGYAIHLRAAPPLVQRRMIATTDYRAFLIDKGPLYFLERGGIACLLPAAWLLLRAVRPPMREVLIPGATPLK